MNMDEQDDKDKRWRLAMGWLCVHLTCSIYGLSLVPGYEYFLLTAILIGVLVIIFLRQLLNKKALALSAAFSLACGFSARKLVYEQNGLTGGVTLLTIFICLV